MAGVDLNFYRFDFDLTFAALLMNADGTIYHTFAGRDWRSPVSHLTLPGLARVLRETLPEHAQYQRNPRPPKARPRRTIEQLPKWKREIDRGKPRDCYHCHMVNEAIIEDLQSRRKWKLDKAWQWPDPIQIGITLDKDRQTLVRSVEAGSASDAAGIAPGDVLQALDGKGIRTFGDLQRALDEAPPKATTLPVTFERAGAAKTGKLRLKKGWKRPEPRVFAWRASAWPLSPKPGFGGNQLTPEQLAAAGLPKDGFAFRVNYIVTWGHAAHTGRNALRAGIRKGDIVFRVGGRDDFTDVRHFHSWFRLTRKVGEVVRIELVRNGRREKIKLKTVD